MNQGLPVAGYHPQTEARIAMVNDNKVLEEHLLRLIEELQGRDVDRRWLQIGRTHIEQGFMALNRAICTPGRVGITADGALAQPEQH